MPRRAQFPDKRLVGDRRYMLVHNVDNEHNLCRIDDIIKADAVETFETDSIDEATDKGYDPCESCMGF